MPLLTAVIIVLLSLVLRVLGVMFCWNYLSGHFGLPQVTALQALIGLTLINLINGDMNFKASLKASK